MSDVLLASDEEPEPSSQLPLQKLLRSSCRCNSRHCFTQFRHQADQVQQVREQFKSLSGREKESFVRDKLRIHCQDFKPTSCASMPRLQDDDVLLASDEESDDSSVLLESDAENASESNQSGSVLYETDVDSDDGDDDEQIQEPNRKYAKRRTDNAVFLGNDVCIFSFCRLLGIGQSSLQKLRSGERAWTNSERPQQAKHPYLGFALTKGCVKWASVLAFFCHLYFSCAEVLPKHFEMPRRPATATEEAPFPANSDSSLRFVNEFVRNLHTGAHDPDRVTSIGPGTFGGERRYLQHTTKTELFWEYIAYCNAQSEDAASHSTFFKVASKVIGKKTGHIGIRKSSEHHQCDTCYRLKKLIRQSTDSKKNVYYQQYSEHILRHWLDRQVYWTMRTMSRAYFRQCQLGPRSV